ncbi:MAG: glucokinase [Candidatus Woesearchaeota archaeon]
MIQPDELNHDLFTEFVIVADIGGTNTTIGVFGVKSHSKFKKIFSQRYNSKEIEFYQCINEVLSYAHKKYNISISKGCFDIAGPVDENRLYAHATNLEWGIDVRTFLEKTMLQDIYLLNDFEAIGYGVPLLQEFKEEIEELPHPDGATRKPIEKETIAIIGAGTGLGISILTYDENKEMYVPKPSEGGHADFAPSSDLEWQLLSYLKENVTGKHPGYERVVSGQGMRNIYNFLRHIEYEHTTEVLQMIDNLKEEDKPAAIRQHIHNSTTCEKCLELFIEFYARAARNLALTVLARGGVYLAGGIAPRILKELKKPHFMHTFEINDRESVILRKIPVYVVLDYEVSLLGCCNALINKERRADNS